MAEHFVQAPHWEWWIAFYFFVAGIAGGSYGIATMLRLWGAPHDEATARTGFLLAFPLAVLCGIFLTIDLGQPLRFWHMLVNTTPGAAGLNFKSWSPISIGSWALLIFSIFAFVSFLEAWTKRNAPATKPGQGTILFNAIGALFALFLASYTGVVLSVSNQPVWSDSYSIGGLFVASGLSASAVLLAWLSRNRTDVAAVWTEQRLIQVDGYFVVLELLMIASFFFTLAQAGTIGLEFRPLWLIGWLLVLASLVPGLMSLGGRRVQVASGGGTVATVAAAHRVDTVTMLVIVGGVLLMRLIVIFSAQF